jgi:plastocyanin
MKRTYLFPVMALIAVSCGGAAPTTTTAATTTSAAPSTSAATSTTAAVTTTAEATTTSNGATAGATVDVFVEDFSFSPSTVTINVGDAVRWNLVGGSHTTTSGTSPTPDGMWNQTLQADSPVTVTFTEAGSFSYFCRFHGDFMTGTVVVEP